MGQSFTTADFVPVRARLPVPEAAYKALAGHAVALVDFVRGYLACALWLVGDDVAAEAGRGLYDFRLADLAPEAVAEAVADCAAFAADHAADLAAAADLGRDFDSLGHDFFLSRNGHGAGFFDRGPEAVWRRLQSAARVWGSSDLYLGRGGRLYWGG
jgi:hypothetical protein